MEGRNSVSGVELAIFSGKLNSICEEMGYVLQRSALSPNIKDRLDFSCAVFDSKGAILAQAAHIPVHLGSMAYAMSSLVSQFEWQEGDVVVVNDPFQGGTHLPDVTVVSPLFFGEVLTGFVVNRAHHANIGASAPGSMPLSESLDEEGVIISPVKLYVGGELDAEVAGRLRAIDPTCTEAIPEDFIAQVSANRTGITRLLEWLETFNDPCTDFNQRNEALNQYGASLMSSFISDLPEGTASFVDYLDDDGCGSGPIKIEVSIERRGDKLTFDFSGTDPQVKGNLNCPVSVSAAAVYYLVACMLPEYAPKCDGVFKHIHLSVPKGSLLNANQGAAVAAGNVETSMRVVDVVQGALRRLGVDMPAASQGTMNNIAMGYEGVNGQNRWDYYETIAGGMGAHSQGAGSSAVQCHMTNTLNTPVESLELHYPLRIDRYEIREHTGGLGTHAGGNGLCRTYCFLQSSHVTLLTDRRNTRPWGVESSDGAVGLNLLNGEVLPAKVAFEVTAGDKVTVSTPGGGGWSNSVGQCD